MFDFQKNMVTNSRVYNFLCLQRLRIAFLNLMKQQPGVESLSFEQLEANIKAGLQKGQDVVRILCC